MTEEQIAKMLGISYRTLCNYKESHEEFLQALKKGRANLVAELKSTLIKKAKGYTFQEKEIIEENGKQRKKIIERYAHPDVAAIHLLLKNYDSTWKNDDAETLALKKKHIEIEAQKAEDTKWH